MKTVKVAVAVIADNGRILAAQKGYGQFEGGWEFPGGKIEPGETAQQALIRELREELELEVSVRRLLRTVAYDYPDFRLIMYCFLCGMKEGKPVRKEHKALKWLGPGDLDSVEWLPADVEFIGWLREHSGEWAVGD